MTINIYPSKIRVTADGVECEPIERHSASSRLTLLNWLEANVNGFEFRAVPPISIHVNGEFIPASNWSKTYFSEPDAVDIFPEPKGAEIGAFLLAYGGYIAIGASLIYAYLMPRPTTPKVGTQAQGRRLDQATATGNKVKLNSVIREVGGRRKIFPDYLLPPRRYFSEPTQQTVQMLLCIGMGEFEIDDADVLIGDTPFSSLGDNASYAIYGPGESLSGDESAEWWHSATEVGATSVGSTGIELATNSDATDYPDSNILIFSGDTITIPDGEGTWPDDWSADMNVRCAPEYEYTVSIGSPRNVISGDLAMVAPFVGMNIEIDGDNAGEYVVHSFTAGDSATPDQMELNYLSGDPVGDLKTGTVSMAIGFAGLSYQIVSIVDQVMTVERLDDEGIVDGAWLGFDDVTMYSAVVQLDKSNLVGTWSGPFAACPAGETTDRIEWDIFFPSGLIKINKEGKSRTISVTVELQYRELGSGSEWTSIIKTYSGKSLDQVGYTELQSLGSSYRPEVRARRIGASENSTRIQDATQWYGLRAKLPIKTSYAGVTTMTCVVNGGKKIAYQSENNISVVGIRKLPVLSGGSWSANAANRSIASFFSYVAKSLGYTDDDIDIVELQRLETIWQARGDYLDISIEEASTAKEVMNSALRPGFAEFTVSRGVLLPVRDEVRTVYEQMYTPQNMLEPLTRQFSTRSVDEADGIDVEYVDENTWSVETVECRLPEDLGIKVEKVTIDGVTNRARAWRLGMRQRRMQKYRKKSYRFATELDALNSRYFSFCALADDTPGYAQSAIMLGYDSGVIHSSEPLDWSAGGSFVVGIRKPDGRLSGPYAATRIDDYTLLINDSEIDFEPSTSWEVEPPHLLFGPLTRWNYPALITSITPGADGTVEVEAANYDARVYDDDDNAP